MTDHDSDPVENLDAQPVDSENVHPFEEREAADALPADVQSALSSLDELSTLPLTDHVERYQQIHSGLQSALSDIEDV